MNTYGVLLPCRRFTVQVQFGPQEGLSPVEQFTLRAVAAGADSMPQLRDVLRLDERVALDLCVDLLRGGFLFVDRLTGRLELAPTVREEMGDPVNPSPDWAQKLASTRPSEPREYALLQELVSGAVFPASRELGRGQARLRAPENERLPLVQDIQKPQLMHAVARAVRNRLMQEDGGSSAEQNVRMSLQRQRVIDVKVVGNGPSASMGGVNVGRELIAVEMSRKGGAEDDSDAPALRIIGPSTLPSSIRQSISRGLVALWHQGLARERGQFFPILMERFRDLEEDNAPELATADPVATVHQLVSAASGLETLPAEPEALRAAHERLAELERDASDQVDEAITHAAHAQLVVGARAHHEAVLSALDTAEHQVLLVNPWVRQLEHNESLRNALLGAVTRGVRVHLLWGVSRQARFEDEFGPQARKLLEVLAPREQKTGGLFVAQEPCAVHAKLVVCDLRWALASSANFLNSSAERSEHEIGVRVEAPGSGEALAPQTGTTWSPTDARPPVIRALRSTVQWARSLIQDYRLQRIIMDDPALEGQRQLIAPVDFGVNLHAPEASALSINIWKGEWQRRARLLQSRIQGAGTLVMPVADVQHRKLLLDALRLATRRVVISSRALGIGVLGVAPASVLEEAVRRNVSVTIFFHDEGEVQEELATRREALARAGVRFLRRRVHSKVLVCDDWAVVTSFNFLSFEGYYDSQRVARHEFGFRIFDPALCDALIDSLESAPPP
ncbi:phospholipase D-like domain-containing protein [Pyxidicoccus caerfyrddinensis]|uniref:phospholipase D-like domain-containing protein n=1 Tax=Pyxidicoccus caerfyrddinensis TaxID=2709663 RepID=UPI0013DC5CBC|nr:phospholipase D-like domain-containing protein [Pyxidicoccus caerfyrddinensis]